MWTSILALAVALNFEPTRFALVPMILSRRRPVVQLLAYYVGSFTVSLSVGLLILFGFRRNPLGTNASTGGKVQIAVGLVALIVALIMAVRWSLARRGQEAGPIAAKDTGTKRGIDKVFVGARAILRRGGSPWIAGLLGMAVGLPSFDYLAVLVIIATSHTPSIEQVAALVSFLFIGGLVVVAPLVGYMFAPVKTLHRIEQFAAWTRSRSQIEYAGILTLVGMMLIGMGWLHI